MTAAAGWTSAVRPVIDASHLASNRAMTDSQHETIRDYRPGDLDGLIELVRELQAHEAGLYDRMRPAAAMGSWYVAHLQRQCRDHAGRLLVAQIGERLVGYATILTRIEEEALDEIAHSFAYVGDLAVSKEMRGRGLARRLLAACETEAQSQGATYLRVTVLTANDRARDIYRAFGFSDLFVDMEKPIREKDPKPCD
jgi:ribosomal protein S18 acetylase RimI-like enzyme